MTTSKKFTKRDYYSTILNILDTATLPDDSMTIEELKDFINHEIGLLDTRRAASAKRTQNRREEGDILRSRILEVMSAENFMSINEILKALDDEDISAQMVVARLTQCVKAGLAEKESISVPGKQRKSSIYRKVEA